MATELSLWQSLDTKVEFVTWSGGDRCGIDITDMGFKVNWFLSTDVEMNEELIDTLFTVVNEFQDWNNNLKERNEASRQLSEPQHDTA